MTIHHATRPSDVRYTAILAQEHCAPSVQKSPTTLSEVLKRTVAMRDYAREVAGSASNVRCTLCHNGGASPDIAKMASGENAEQVSQGLIQDIMTQLGELQSALDAATADLTATAARLG